MQRVESSAADNRIVAGPARQIIMTANTSGDEIMATAGVNRIVARAANEGVMSGAGRLDQVMGAVRLISSWLPLAKMVLPSPPAWMFS